MKTTVLLDHGPAGDGHWRVRALVRIGGTAPAQENRLPLNVALVLDRSGSMAGRKLAAVREAAAGLVRRLAPDDTLSVVAYDDAVRTVVPARKLGEATSVIQQIEAIESGGSTNLSGGWLRGRELALQARGERTINRILLMTDGLANAGITDASTLCGFAAQAREQGLTTSTIGFGEDYDEHLLRAMADAGGGQTYYIERPDQAAAIYNHEIEGLLGVAAQNLSVTVRSLEARLTRVHHNYEQSAENGALRLELGDLYASEPRAVLFEFLLERPQADQLVTVAELIVRGVCLDHTGVAEMRTITMPVRVSIADGPRVDPEVQREALLQQAAHAREEALRARDAGDVRAAVEALRSAAATISAEHPSDEILAHEVRDLFSLAESSLNAADAKYLHQRAHDRRRSRHSKAELIRRPTSEE